MRFGYLAFLALLIICVLASPRAHAELSEEEAGLAALEKIHGKIIGIEREAPRRSMTYEIEIKTPDDNLYEIDIDSETGEILEVDKLGKLLTKEKRMDMATAEKTALDHINTMVKGGAATTLHSEFKHVGGKPLYEFEVKIRTRIYEVRVNAETGDVISVKEE